MSSAMTAASFDFQTGACPSLGAAPFYSVINSFSHFSAFTSARWSNKKMLPYNKMRYVINCDVVIVC